MGCMERGFSTCAWSWKNTPERQQSGNARDENKIMSMRCKVCNSSKTANTDQTNDDDGWECNTCGNLLDAHGKVIQS